jgi:hypothetical protein
MKRKQHIKQYIIFITATFIGTISAASAIDLSEYSKVYYVSPGGSDTSPGTETRPFATISQALDRIRSYKDKNKESAGNICVFFRGGHYKIAKSVVFSEIDSAPAGARIFYRAYPGEKVVFSGGRSLKRSWFEPLSDKDPRKKTIIDKNAVDYIRYIPLKKHDILNYGKRSYHGFVVGSGTTPPMELFIDGQVMTLARWPNEGYAPMDEKIPLSERIIEPGDEINSADSPSKGGAFYVDFDRLKYWSKAEDVWLDGVVGREWSWQSHKVASIDAENKIIKLRDPAPYTISMTPRFFVENLLEEIDKPGEYFIDRETGYLYLYPPKNFEDDTSVSVSTLAENMLVIDGATNITFEGITLEIGRSSAIEVIKGNANRFVNLQIKQFTGPAVLLNGRNNGLKHCNIHHVGSSGVILDGGDSVNLIEAGNYVEDTSIFNFANYDKVYTPAVKMLGVGNRVSHCEIHDGPHGGITVGGNEQLIEYTIFHDLVKRFNDFGAIYAAIGGDPTQRGNVIRRNFFYDIGAEVGKWRIAIYSDWLSQGFTIEENVFYRIGSQPGMHEYMAVVNSSGRYNKILNNVFVDCAVPYERGYNMSYNFQENGRDKELEKTWQDLFRDKKVLNGIYGVRYPELHQFFTEDMWFPTTCRFERNLIYNKAVPFDKKYIIEHFIMDRSSKGWGKHEDLKNARDNWVTDQDPGFVDLDAVNLMFKPDARVFDEIPGFRNIPFNEIGIRKNAK